MHIEINNKTALSEIQDIFSDYYQWLRIEFYNKAHKKYEGSEINNLIYADSKVGDIIKTPVSGSLEIQPGNKVGDLEREFQRRFGLSAQIMMKQRDQWVQTVSNDNLSLKELNELSRNASDEYILSEEDDEE